MNFCFYVYIHTIHLQLSEQYGSNYIFVYNMMLQMDTELLSQLRETSNTIVASEPRRDVDLT